MQYIIARFIPLLLTLCISIVAAGQQSVGIGTANPNPNAALDISSTTKGVMIPTLTAAQQTTLAAMLGPGETGMLVTDATTSKLVSYSGGSFQPLTTTNAPTAAAPLSFVANNLQINPGTAAGDLLTWNGNNWVNMQPAQHFNIAVDNRQPWLAINFSIALFGIFPTPNDANLPYVGEIFMMGCNFAPRNFAPCNGALMAISENEVLYTLIGTTYGGDGVNTFALPDLRGRIPIDVGNNGTSINTIGEVLGQEQKTFTH